MADTDIQITEILYDTSSTFPISDVEGEWVELYNSGSSTVNLDGWTITDTGGGVTSFASGQSLQAGQYGIVYNSVRISETDFTNYYGPFPANTVLIGRTGDLTDWAAMSNSGDGITLRNGSSTIIEQMNYPDLAADGQSVSVGGTDGAETFLLQSTPTPGGPVCFAAGTLIATPNGEKTVESLATGDLVLTDKGACVPLLWVARQTIVKRFYKERAELVCMTAGSLGTGLPHSDLTVTADHGMILEGLTINASVLVNNDSIHWVPLAELPRRFVVYHLETEKHDVVLANGAPTETFLDAQGRACFDNYQEYIDLYGADRIVHEMDLPRISSKRLLPQVLKARLGISDDSAVFAEGGQA